MESPKRLVLFAGPHKSASSSVQEFFMRHASNQRKKHPQLANWTWPFNPRVRSFLPRKGFAPLVVEYSNVELRTTIYNRLQAAWESGDSSSGVVFGSEEFDRFGSCPWSQRNATHVVQEVLDLLKPQDFVIVINYRIPRHEQWISIWKQLTRTRPIPYRDYLCKDDIKTWEYLDSVANPLGLAQEFRSNGWEVRLVDMYGVAQAKLDVANVITCEILNVQCTDGWLEGQSQIFQNTKTGNPELSATQLEEIEKLLLERDCAYQKGLENDPGFSVLHKHSLWKGCQGMPSKNTTILLNRLRQQVGCGQDDIVSVVGSVQQHPHSAEVENPVENRLGKTLLLSIDTPTPQHLDGDEQHLQFVVRSQQIMSLFLAILLMAYAFHRRWRRKRC